MSGAFAYMPSSKFYLPFDFYNPQPEFLSILTNIINNKSWTITRDRIFYSCIPKNYVFPEHGWKIHISGKIWDSEEILKKVSHYCYTNAVAFKCLMDKRVFDINNNKAINRSSSGKFITIYPKDTEHFLMLIKDLFFLLEKYEGPYILTDRRYGEKGIVYYRYGGIALNTKYKDGQPIHLLTSPNGDIFIDDRKPIFQLPNWVKDPFENTEKHLEKEKPFLLNNRYKIKSAIRFTNAGGTYLADDMKTNKEVIIKEARPFTVQYGHMKDARDLKKTEFNILKKIGYLHVSPEPIEIFEEWEHTFLVEDFIEGQTIKQFVAHNAPFSIPNSGTTDMNSYYEKVAIIMISILESLLKIHSENVIVGDIGADNIILHENGTATFIDFDASINLDTEYDKQIFRTIGFSNQYNQVDNFKRDLIGIGYLLFYMLVPCSNLIEQDDNFYVRFLKYMEKKYGLPREFRILAESLISLDYSKEIQDCISLIKDINVSMTIGGDSHINTEEINEIIEKVARFILNNQLQSDNQLFPSDINATEFISVTHGATGVLRALSYCGVKYSRDLDRFVSNNVEKNFDKIGLGLHYGLSGICWYMLENGEVEKAKEFISIIETDLHTVKSLDLSEGLSGIGLLYLKFYSQFRDKAYLKKARMIGESLINENKEAIANLKQIGYAQGKSGIALFLLYLSQVCEDKKYSSFGKEILIEEIYTGKEINNGYLYPSQTDTSNFYYPYFKTGTAGIASVAVRYLYVLQDKRLEDEVKKLGNGLFCELAVDMGLYAGLSGIANSLFDLYQFTREKKYLYKTFELINNMKQLLLNINENEIGTPGSLMYRLSCDYSTGGAGFIMLLNRVVNNQSNFHFFLDEFILKEGKYKQENQLEISFN
ncbi:class III lanthionine synthetase LanKC [Sporosarcina sp. USHLN248]|uniref:class III lanthionine synthetase LanKC n=1 Tax=Sporosarcina sp. USHLN248 TaxID=3081300 RepID=UPI00301974C6